MLQVRLLGEVAAERDGEQVTLPPPAGRLLALLALRPGPHDREAAAALLWPGSARPAARANFAINMVWQLAEADAGTSIQVNVTAPESEARRLDGQHQLIEESLRRLTTLAEAAS